MTRSTHCLLGLLLASLTACGGDREPPAPEAGRSPAAECPASDFLAFLALYAESPRVQREWTRFPLERLTLAEGPDEPTPVLESVSREQARFPLLPSRGRRAADSLEIRTEEAADGGWRVVIEKPDTDRVVHYLFQSHGECWRLVRIEDRSL